MNWTRIIQLEMSDRISEKAYFVDQFNQRYKHQHLLNQIQYCLLLLKKSFLR